MGLTDRRVCGACQALKRIAQATEDAIAVYEHLSASRSRLWSEAEYLDAQRLRRLATEACTRHLALHTDLLCEDRLRPLSQPDLAPPEVGAEALR